MAPQPQRPDEKTFLPAVITVAAAYVYFLIFAQFGFIAAAKAAWAGADGVVPSLLAGMGLGGIGGSALAARIATPARARSVLAGGFLLCGLAAAGAVGAKSIAAFSAVALLTGTGVAFTTVALAGILRAAAGEARLGLIAGLGTGAAYGFCNLPGVFDAGLGTQVAVAITAVGAGLLASRWLSARFAGNARRDGDYSPPGVAAWVAVFLGLVCFDSALFHFIQHAADLKRSLWGGAGRQAANALTHVLAAVLAGWALDRGWLGRTVALAGLALLASGGWIAGRQAGHDLGALVYIASVSVYSTALVFYPARSGRPAVAGWVYAVAGWGGSAIGIGLAEETAGLPPGLLAAAGVLLAAALATRHFASRRKRTMNENSPV